MNGEGAPNGFVILGRELRSRFLTPIRQVSFWVFLAIGVVGIGGLGVWLEIGLYLNSETSESSSHIRTALLAFFPALSGSVALQLCFEEAGRNKRMMAFAAFVGFLVSLVALILILDRGISDRVAIPLGSIACIGSVLVWWIANGLNPTFQDELNIEAVVGGSPSQTPSGDLTDFKA